MTNPGVEDERTRTERLYDAILAEGIEPGTLYRYDWMTEIVGQDIRECRYAVDGAEKRLEKHHKRTLQNVPTVGYRVAHSKEIADLVDARQRRALNQVNRALREVSVARMDELTQEERHAVDRRRSAALAGRNDMRRHLRYAMDLPEPGEQE